MARKPRLHPLRQAATVIAMAILADTGLAQTGPSLVRPAHLLDVRRSGLCVEATVSTRDDIDRDTAELILLREDCAPLARLSFQGAGATGWLFAGESVGAPRSGSPASQPESDFRGCKAYWLDLGDLRTTLADTGLAGEFFTTINTVGPGNESVWLEHGAEHGARVGDTWWLRINGQPAARFETLVVAPQLSFARVTLLAADLSLRPGQRVAIWPAPVDELLGHVRSAVARIELRESLCIAWVARPPGPAPPPDSHVEFKRGGEAVALGSLERSDALFSYVRITARLLEGAEYASSAVQATTKCGVQTGDSADFRTSSDIEAGRYVIRVFATPSGGRLINAGEPEGLQSGAVGDVVRKGQRVGTARVERVQTGYSVLSYEVPPQSGDVFQLRPPPARERPLGKVVHVVENGLLLIRSEPDVRLAIGQLASVYVSGEVAAVAVVLDVRGDGSAAAAVLDPTVARPFTAGAALVGF